MCTLRATHAMHAMLTFGLRPTLCSRADREDAIEEKKGDDGDGKDGDEDDAVEDKNQKKARAKARRREAERKRREAKAKAENSTSYKPPQTPMQWCCNAANMLSLNAYVTCVVAVFSCQVTSTHAHTLNLFVKRAFWSLGPKTLARVSVPAPVARTHTHPSTTSPLGVPTLRTLSRLDQARRC